MMNTPMARATVSKENAVTKKMVTGAWWSALDEVERPEPGG